MVMVTGGRPVTGSLVQPGCAVISGDCQNNSTKKLTNVILATARPSRRYRNYMSIADLILQAQLVNGRVIYYETHLNKEWTVQVKEETVKAMFPVGKSLRDQPFRGQENRDFYTVLNRHRNRYKAPYQALVKGTTPKIKRTKHTSTKIKRTKR